MDDIRLVPELKEERKKAYETWCPCPDEAHLCVVACCPKCQDLPKRSIDDGWVEALARRMGKP